MEASVNQKGKDPKKLEMDHRHGLLSICQSVGFLQCIARMVIVFFFFFPREFLINREIHCTCWIHFTLALRLMNDIQEAL